jgi:hypothetical protein
MPPRGLAVLSASLPVREYFHFAAAENEKTENASSAAKTRQEERKKRAVVFILRVYGEWMTSTLLLGRLFTQEALNELFSRKPSEFFVDLAKPVAHTARQQLQGGSGDGGQFKDAFVDVAGSRRTSQRASFHGLTGIRPVISISFLLSSAHRVDFKNLRTGIETQRY